MDNDTTVTATFGKLIDYTATVNVRARCPDCGGDIQYYDEPFYNTDDMLVAQWICVECKSSGTLHVFLRTADA